MSVNVIENENRHKLIKYWNFIILNLTFSFHCKNTKRYFTMDFAKKSL